MEPPVQRSASDTGSHRRPGATACRVGGYIRSGCAVGQHRWRRRETPARADEYAELDGVRPVPGRRAATRYSWHRARYSWSSPAPIQLVIERIADQEIQRQVFQRLSPQFDIDEFARSAARNPPRNSNGAASKSARPQATHFRAGGYGRASNRPRRIPGRLAQRPTQRPVAYSPGLRRLPEQARPRGRLPNGAGDASPDRGLARGSGLQAAREDHSDDANFHTAQEMPTGCRDGGAPEPGDTANPAILGRAHHWPDRPGPDC